jgi:hypothetical protein
MQGRQRRRDERTTARARGQSSRTGASGVLALPAWESFPEEDRRRLVQGLLQAARRHVECVGPADRLLGK